jgi:hypothetical protein
MKFITCIVGRLDTLLLDFLHSSFISFGYLMSELISISVPSIQSVLSLVSAVVLLFNEPVIVQKS